MSGYQIPRNSLAWLLVAQAGAIAPHVGRLPVWVVLVCLACIGWRVMVFRGRWNYPGRWVKVLFVVGGVVGIPLGYRTILGLEPAVAMLVVAYVLKLLEMHHKRDAYIVVLLGYFVAMTQFLFSQTIPWTGFIVAVIMAITAGLVGLNQTRTHRRPLVAVRTAGTLVLQAVPLMLVLWVLFPRLPPLWTVPMPNQIARSGVSDEMSPGDIAELAASSDLAFKATFSGAAPPFSQLYWRGLVLSGFDGRTWFQEDNVAFGAAQRYRAEPPAWAGEIERRGGEFRYEVILEPTQQNWLFTLTVPTFPDEREIVMARDFRLAYTEPIRTKVRYQVTSHLDYQLSPLLSDRARRYYTDINQGGRAPENNPRSRALATGMRAAAGSDEAYLRDVLRRYNTQEFTYTLRPTVLGEHSIDEFLFDTQRGFCEHFAGSFAFMMRAAGIPARVVVGYQGGEYNQFADYIAVYQYDAHAWTEVWLEGQGWRRVDPVTAVAPDRIERGLEAAVEQEQTFRADDPFWAFSRQTLWLAELRLQMSAIGYYWDTLVVGYTPSVQNELLSRFLGDFDRKQLGMLMLAIFFGVLGLIGLVVLLKRPHQSLLPLDREFLKYCEILARQGLAREVGEGALHYASRIAATRPDLAEPARDVTRAYVDLNYARGTGSPAARAADISGMTRAVRRFRLKTLA